MIITTKHSVATYYTLIVAETLTRYIGFIYCWQTFLIMEDFEDDYFDDDESAYHDCPKCGRSYDEIDYEYQSCSKCGWDAEKETWGETREPEQADYEMGDADILTGRWL